MEHEQLLRNYSQFRQVVNALNAYCEATGRTPLYMDELSKFYAKNKRRDYRVPVVITATREVMILTKDRLGELSTIEYLRREGKAAFAILCLEHKTRPLFRRGYSAYLFGLYADGINATQGTNWRLLFRDSDVIKRDDGQYNLLGENGEPISEIWFDSVDDFFNDMALVEKDGKRGLLGRDGKLIAGMWFDYVSSKIGIPRKVYLSGAFNYLKPNGEFLYDEWTPID